MGENRAFVSSVYRRNSLKYSSLFRQLPDHSADVILKSEIINIVYFKKNSIRSLHPIQVSELTSHAARLTKERDSALSKMSLWMKTCKQLEQEKEMMLNSSGE